MQNKSNLNTILLVIIITLLVVGLGYFMFFNPKQDNNVNFGLIDNVANINQIKIPDGVDQGDNKNIKAKNAQVEQADYQSIATSAFGPWSSNQGVTDFKISKFSLLATKDSADTEQKQYFNPTDSGEAFIAQVDFMVKTTPGGKSMWLAGSGVQKADGWISNSLLMTFDKDASGSYTVKNAGTGL